MQFQYFTRLCTGMAGMAVIAMLATGLPALAQPEATDMRAPAIAPQAPPRKTGAPDVLDLLDKAWNAPDGAQPEAFDLTPSFPVISWYRFGEDRFPGLNIRIEQFEAHLKELADGDYLIRPLPDLVADISAGNLLVNRTLGLTIDGARRSMLAEAWPRLRAAGLPFTLFVDPGPLDRNRPDHMSWAQLRRIAASDLVTIGLMTPAGLDIVNSAEGRVIQAINRSMARIEEELGLRPRLLAWHRGHYDARSIARLERYGFQAGFGRHSGVIWPDLAPMTWPRFAMTENFGDIERFRLAINALALPVSDIVPESPDTGQNPPAIGFTLHEGLAGQASAISCFAGGRGEVEVMALGDQRVEVRMDQALPPGPARLNCTMPERLDIEAQSGRRAPLRWRWLGLYLRVPAVDEAG